MRRGLILPPRIPLVIPEATPRPSASLAAATTPDRPGRVTLEVGGQRILADMCASSSLSSHVVDGEDAIVLAFAAPSAPVGLYQPLDLDDALGLANALIGAVDEIRQKRLAELPGDDA